VADRQIDAWKGFLAIDRLREGEKLFYRISEFPLFAFFEISMAKQKL